MTVELFNPTFNSAIDGSIVTDSLTSSFVEDSDEIKGDITLIVKEDKVREIIVEMVKIFDGDIDLDSKDVILIENLPRKDINVDNASIDNTSVFYADESRNKDLRQDIDNKHPIIR